MFYPIVLKAREDTQRQINEACNNFYSKKLEAYNIISNKENTDQKKYKYILLHNREDQEKYFGEVFTYIPTFMNTLWESPKIVADILKKSDKNDLKNNIAPFIASNFYENILSSNYIEDQLLYIICLLLKDEINNEIKTKNDINKFLENTPCGILLEQLKLKQDVQTYFKTLIYQIVQKLEEKNSSFEMKFNVKEIEEDFRQTKEEVESEYKKTGKKQKIIVSDFFKKSYEEYSSSKSNSQEGEDKDLFNIKYIPSLTKDELKKLMDENKKNQNMTDFFLSQWHLCKDNPDIFSNDTLLKNVFQSELSKEILASYQLDFLKVIKILEELIKSFLKHLYLLPYSVKCICKMIFILIKKKFPDLSLAETNAFISKFFFDKLFSPIFENPGTWALINDFIISGVTRHNLKIISFLMKKIFQSKFFISNAEIGDYTPFNWFIVDHIFEVYKFLGNLIQIKLPNFIEKMMNNELPNSYEYDYFKENPEEGIFHRSICFSFDDLYILLKNMEILKEKLFNNYIDINKNEKNFILKKTLEKLLSESCTEEMEHIKKNIEYETTKIYENKKRKESKEIKGNQIINYILFSDILTSKNYTKIFKLNKENCFTLQEIKSNKNATNDERKANVTKVKNFIYKLLNNYRTLVKTDFIEGTVNTTINILKELKKYMKVSNFIIDGSIPSQWYVDSLLEYLKKIPTDLTNNDCSNLFKEIISGLNVSIKDMDFEALSVVLSTVKFCKRRENYYQKMKKCLIDIELNERVQSIIDNSPISVELAFKYSNKTKELKIEKSHKRDIKLESLETTDDIILAEEVKKSFYCKTIKAFTKRFPYIAKYQQILEKYEKNLMDIENDFKLTHKLNNYFNIIKDFLLGSKSGIYNQISSNELDDILNKIYDYVMEKLYDKLILPDPDPIDNKIYGQCNLLSWVEPKNFIKSKTNYVFDSFLPDVIQYFEEIEKQKSPRQKLIYMSKIFQSISNMVKFSGGGDIGTDDSQEILNYALIKAKPVNLYTDCKYMNLFIGDKKYKEQGLQLTQLRASCEFIQKIGSDKLYEVDDELFFKRCSTFYK